MRLSVYLCTHMLQTIGVFSHIDRWRNTPLDEAIRHKRTEVERYLKQKTRPQQVQQQQIFDMNCAVKKGDLDELKR